MGFEIPIDSGYPRHRKTVDLKVRLKDPQADIYPLRLFFWAAENARDGVIRVPPRALELALGWGEPAVELGRRRGRTGPTLVRHRGRTGPGLLYRALKASGFIEADGVTIHDWMDGVGRAIQAYEIKKFNLRKTYAEKHGLPFTELPPGSGSLPADFQQSAPIQSNPSLNPNRNNPPSPNGGSNLPAEKPKRTRRGARPTLDDIEREVTSGGDRK